MVEIALSYIALVGFATGSLGWLMKSTSHIARYVERNQHALSELNDMLVKLESRDKDFQERMLDIEIHLERTSDFRRR